ncbi:MAG: selenide, water dikinase SelD [Bacteroidales bacterium]|nr:selenide, water dikinase SelD [Bacteroidales bacterium]MBN2819912.1 selenide, water dikinase SelD [Bacteroidales bacterium]
MNNIKLTQFSHGAGCGCKISPKALSSILESKMPELINPNLLVGNASRDDAAVYDLKNGTAIISTTDFFMPIVDDPYMFGKIASANAISDVYAMGGKPLLAISILGWPIDKIPTEVAREVLEGARETCAEAGISLAGGHSIDSPEPIFGLAVTGSVEVEKLKRNNTATPGCRLILTKPLGVGVLTTAQKKNKLKPEHALIAPNSMKMLNKIGQSLAEIKEVRAMTDVTGFGLLGHLTEMCQGSGLSAEIEYNKIPMIDEAAEYIKLGCIPGGTHRNWDSYGHIVNLRSEDDKFILCDPQTSGGLLVAVEEKAADRVIALLMDNGINSIVFGRLVQKPNVNITVI